MTEAQGSIPGMDAPPRLFRSGLLAGTAILAALLAIGPAAASSHREAPGITATPRLDGTDFYMFTSYETGRGAYTTLIADYYPLQAPGGGPNYFEMEPNGVYEIHMNNDGSGAEDITFQFQFQNKQNNIFLNVGGMPTTIPLVQAGQIGVKGDPTDIGALNVNETFTVKEIFGNRRTGERFSVTNAADGSNVFTKPVDNIGFKTLPNYAAYAANFVYTVNIPGCATPGKLFVGQRKDPFVVNLGGTFDLLNWSGDNQTLLMGEGNNNVARDDLADANVTALEMEVPTACLVNQTTKDPVIGGWTTSSTGTPGANGDLENLTQVSRLGMPLVNELVIGLSSKDAFNASEPKDDVANGFGPFVTNPTLPALMSLVGGGTQTGIIAPTLFPRTDLVATFLTGIQGVNMPSKTPVVPAEMARLNTAIPPTPAATQNRLGVIVGDNAGFPNGRRPGDDVVDIELRVAMGRLITLGLFGTPAQAPSGAIDFTDGALVAANYFDTNFPYLKTPIAGSPGKAQPTAPLPANAVGGAPNPVSENP
jgi:hypothetical protein